MYLRPALFILSYLWSQGIRLRTGVRGQGSGDEGQRSGARVPVVKGAPDEEAVALESLCRNKLLS